MSLVQDTARAEELKKIREEQHQHNLKIEEGQQAVAAAMDRFTNTISRNLGAAAPALAPAAAPAAAVAASAHVSGDEILKALASMPAAEKERIAHALGLKSALHC